MYSSKLEIAIYIRIYMCVTSVNKITVSMDCVKSL